MSFNKFIDYNIERCLYISVRKKNRLVSSANMIDCKILEARYKLLTYTRKRNGPNINPCSTPR